MEFIEQYKDLFSVSDEYYLAHCVSADFGMGRGIVVEFNKRFDMKNKLQSKYGNYLPKYTNGNCVLEGRVFNLITKPQYWSKPTYTSMKNALISMRDICEGHKITKVAMPTIGCGLDKLEWDKVSYVIQDVFKDTDIKILVCKQKEV